MYQAFRIHREIFDLNWNPLGRPETVHGITSLTAWQANPADLLAGNRGHWQVENREHYVRARVAEWIEEYNTTRRHSALGMLSPVQWELAQARGEAA